MKHSTFFRLDYFPLSTLKETILQRENDYHLLLSPSPIPSRALCVGAEAAWSKDRFKEETGQIFKLIFHKYNRWVRPPQQYVNVSVELKVDRINHLDALREELEAVVGMEMVNVL